MKTIIISLFYNIVRDLLKYQENDQLWQIYDKVLYFILEIYNCQNQFYDYSAIIQKNKCLKTTTDKLVLNINNNNINEDDKLYLQIKAQIIEEEKINNTSIFDSSMFKKEVTKKALKGNIYSNMLLAILYNEGIIMPQDTKKAIYYFKVLSYANDSFFMLCLIKTYQKNKNNELATDWKKLKEVLDITNDFYYISLDKTYEEYLSPNAIKLFKIILALRNRHMQKNQNILDLGIINYAMKSQKPLIEILENICCLNSDGYQLLMEEEYFENNQYNF